MRAVTAAPPAGALVVGRYALYGKIASGGMATVYFGRMLGAAGFMRTVAIKRLHPHLADEPDFVSMMVDEARLVARVQHPNVAQTLDIVNEGGELIIVMEYVAGESLSRLLRAEAQRQRAIPPAIASSVMSGVLHGLHAAHTAKTEHGEPLGIVHRDVSPHNIIVGVDGLARASSTSAWRSGGGRMPDDARRRGEGQAPVHGARAARRGGDHAPGRRVRRGRRALGAADGPEALQGGRRHHALQDGPRRGERSAEPVGVLHPASPRHRQYVRAVARSCRAPLATAREMADALGRAVAPALASDVGAWVEDAAKQVLDERNAQLAQIESQSSVPARQFRAPPAPSTLSSDELPTIVSQSAMLSIESPGGAARLSMPPRRAIAWVAGTVAVSAVAGLAVALALARRRRLRRPRRPPGGDGGDSVDARPARLRRRRIGHAERLRLRPRPLWEHTPHRVERRSGLASAVSGDDLEDGEADARDAATRRRSRAPCAAPSPRAR